MKIPIQNVYYLLCYAWDKLAERDVVAVDCLDATSLLDLFARVLINGVNHLLKRGFDRGYELQHEWTGRLRGRICFQEAIRRNAAVTGRLPCDYDELSYNVLHNRILKATMRQLIRARGLDTKSAERLSQLCRLLSEIEDIELTGRVFGRVQLHRNNQFYDFLLKVCELIHRNLLVSQRPGFSKFQDFDQDEQQMAHLYEAFVRNFYRTHSRFQVKGEDIRWRWTGADETSTRLLPKMRTDVSLTAPDRKIIIDCKFTPEVTQHHHGVEKLRSTHLYQINAYMDNLQGENADTCEMMLLYPTVDRPLSADFTFKGHKIYIRTINLDQAWPKIHANLLELVA
ncbi:MAG: 5-methylcytosine-specific restriction endonuclease system specificity protein McrC [Verrucomicrobiales bacterium]|nr:5-methylcytosine-specific restriction endonuclease system specificity protein McrC [Verrucomicrobiales bacterium]